ncbi:MAG: hypothetical protein Q9175_004749 [Cornicularia normoerica]
MPAFKIALAALIGILPLSRAVMALEVVPSPNTITTGFAPSNATAASSCPTVTSTVKPHHCYNNLQMCDDIFIEKTTTVPCGCPPSAPTTTVTKCYGCVNTG